MKTVIILAALALSLLPASTFAFSSVISIAPERLEYGDVAFSLRSETTPEGVVYSATITLSEETDSIFTANLSQVTLRPDLKHIRGLREIPLRQTRNGFEASFEVPSDLLSDESICFVVADNGPAGGPPSATFYVLKLRDFSPGNERGSEGETTIQSHGRP